ncbi:MAG: AMP-binding protein [Cyanobacteria bacterium]|nr:AMP-binding protein [Cyanobacteriota bacterium]
MQQSYSPSEEFKAQANIKEADYQKLMQDFKNDPDSFWLDLAKKNLDWYKEPTMAMLRKDEPFFTWFEDGKTNISYNCVDRHLKTHASKTAIVFEGELGDTRTLTYQDLHDQVCRAANLLKSIGVKKGDTVTLYMPMCPEAIIAMHACLRIGAVHSVVFGGFSAHALRDRIVDLQSRYVITADGSFRRGKLVPLLETVKEAVAGLSFVSSVVCFDRIKQVDSSYDDLELQKSIVNLVTWDLSSFEANCEPEQLDAEDKSFVLYTSGSTGKPKGIVHTTAGYLLWTHLTSNWVFDLKTQDCDSTVDTLCASRNSPNARLANDLQAELAEPPMMTVNHERNAAVGDLYWCTADIGWVTGHSYVAYGPLSNGASIFIYEGAPDYPVKSRFWSMIEKYKISIFYTAPTAVRAFMQWGLEHVEKHDLSSLRLLGSVGEPINPAAWEWFYKNIGKENCPIVDTWWQTETGGIAITTLPGVNAMKPGVAGLPLPGVDADISEEGLLYLRKSIPSMARTIHGDDQRYIDTYWSRLPGLYTAGDAATKDVDGYIKIGGRIDDVINVSGHRLGTAEIESALVSHEMVVEAAVVSIPHELKGEGIVAFVVTAKQAIEEELKQHVVKEIGAIARPERIVICSGLPKTRSGKIMRRLLKDIAQGKEISGDISTLENKQVLEELLAK